MKEVSCKMIAPVLREAERQKLPVDRLAEGTPYDLAYLKNGKERVHWHEYARLMQNARAFWDDDDLIEIGARIVVSPWMLPITLFGRVLFSPRDFYLWMDLTDQGACNLMCSCIRTTSCRETGPNCHEIE